LPFERFLNPERQSTPDIDLDFPDLRREEVIDYVRDKYGHANVAKMITFGTMETKMAIRDVARALGYPYDTGDRISKMIPITPGKKTKIDDLLKKIPDLKQAYENEPDTKKILDLAKKLTGVHRHASTHAAGVVITDKPLYLYTPLQRESKGDKTVTQYDMYALDLNVYDNAIGLMKMDFLGLRNLTILEKSIEFIKASKGTKIDLSDLELNDKLVFEMIARGETTGVFQLESGGMREVAKKLKPTRFSDLSAMIALYRPGPMQFIDDFIEGKRNPDKIHYPHPDLKPILEETYGIIVYQEQVMSIANLIGDYTLGEADMLRRAMGKKKIEIMKKEKIRFTERALKKGYDKKTLENIWAMMERFASYGFNKAHTVSYAMIAYQTAWMKAHYPVEFMAALMTAESGAGSQTSDRIIMAIDECRKKGIKILPPNVNSSETGFSIEKDPDSLGGLAIRFGFSAIKNVGDAAIDDIIKTRKKGGEFNSLSDFCNRVNSQKTNKKVIESLIMSGAMDQFGKRKALLEALPTIKDRADKRQKDMENGQTNLFAFSEKEQKKTLVDNLPEIDDFSKQERLKMEKDLLGLYLTEHPVKDKISHLSEVITHKNNQLGEIEKGRVRIAGMVSQAKVIITKKGNKEMAFLTIEDETAQIEVVVFPNTFSEKKNLLVEDKILLIEAKVEKREEKQSLIAEKITDGETFNPSQNISYPDFTISIPAGTRPQVLVELNSLLKKNPGESRGAIYFPNGKVVNLSFGVNWNQELEDKIKQILDLC